MDKKTSLLLMPQQLLHNKDILQAQHILKTNKAFESVTEELGIRELNDSFAQLPRQAKEILASFNKNNSEKRHTAIQNRFKAGKGGIAYRPYTPHRANTNGICLQYGL